MLKHILNHRFDASYANYGLLTRNYRVGRSIGVAERGPVGLAHLA